MSVYYKEKPIFFKQSLDSIINQTVKPDEIVLVKDGELSKELEVIIERYVIDYPLLFNIIAFKKNQGLGIALREGVNACSYDIIARMDTDDIAMPTRFEKQLSVLKQSPQIDMVGSFISEFDHTIEDITSIKKVPIHNDEIKKYAKRRNPFNHMTVMFRKNAVVKAGNYCPFPLNEDYYLWARMILQNSKMLNIDESLVYARAGDSMFKRRGGINYFYTDIKLQKEYFKLGFINFFEFIRNIILRFPIRLFPNSFRKWVYIKLLWSNIN